VCNGVRCVTQCCASVGAGKTRKPIEEVRLGRIFAQFAENQLNGNPRSADYRLAKHHARVDVGAIGDCHTEGPASIYLREDKTIRLRQSGRAQVMSAPLVCYGQLRAPGNSGEVLQVVRKGLSSPKVSIIVWNGTRVPTNTGVPLMIPESLCTTDSSRIDIAPVATCSGYTQARLRK
jgi:hypothetical protein